MTKRGRRPGWRGSATTALLLSGCLLGVAAGAWSPVRGAGTPPAPPAPAAPAILDGRPAGGAEGLTLIPLQDAAGQELLLRSGARADHGPLAQVFETQANLAYCGVASAVMVLNSLAVPAPVAAGYGTYRFWTQTNLFENPRTRQQLPPAQVARQGMTLQELEGLLASQGLAVRRLHGDALSLDDFRSLLQRSLADPLDRLLVNYDRRALGQAGGGHISPLAAYDARSDRVLILDVARYRYPAVWVPSAALWRAMGGIDISSGRSRGLVVIRPGGVEAR